MNRGVLHSSPVHQIMASGNPSWWCFTNGIRAPEVTPSNNSSSFLLPFPSSPPCSTGWQEVHSQEELQQSWTQLLRGGLVGEEEEEDQKREISSCQAKRVKIWQEQVLLEQAQQEHVSSTMEYLKQENSTNNYCYVHPDDQGAAAKMSSSKNSWSSLRSSPESCIGNYGTMNNLLNMPTSSKSNARHPPPSRSLEYNSDATGGAQKKARLQSSSTQSTFKVRKEKLGDRIAALHQLVSPFGKTDTASVLLESSGYIRFLHNQIEALSFPYFGKTSRDLKHNVCGEEEVENLRSRGLCLVPISCTVHQVGNGADYWGKA